VVLKKERVEGRENRNLGLRLVISSHGVFLEIEEEN
jgi:hypothetical protein